MSSFRTCLRARLFARAFSFASSFACSFALPFAFSSALILPQAAAAQTRLDPVVVTGTREPQPLGRSSADIVVIDASVIGASTADSVEDLIRREAGVQVTRSGGPGQSSGYFIRGANTNGTLVLIDGVRVGSASLGQAEFDALSLAQVDHIEVLRGPASSLYGADAIGGVIQIFTKRGEGALRPTFDAAVGGYGSRQGSIGISGAQSGFDYAVLGGRESSRGVSVIRPNDRFGLYNPDDDGYARTFGNFKLGYSPASGHRIGINVVDTYLNARYDGAEYDANFNPDASPDFRDHLHTTLVSADYRGVVSPWWTTTVQVAANTDDDNSGGTTFSRFKTRRDQATWQNALRLAPGQQVVAAYEYLRERVSGDVFAAEPERHNNAFVLGYSGEFGAQTLEASVRNDANSAYGNNTTGSIGYAWRPGAGWKLRALAGTTFRAPTFNDLYYPGYGVATIKPERGRSFEVGAAWSAGGSELAATLYRNRVKDLIGYDPDPLGTDCPAGFFGCAGNTSRARLQGATITGAQTWGGLTARASVDFLDARDADTGARLTRRAAHQETLAIDYRRGSWSAGGAIVDVGARPDGGVVLGGYAIVDLRAAWRIVPQWQLQAKLLNALDHRVEPIRDYRGLGRQAWLGVSYDGRGL